MFTSDDFISDNDSPDCDLFKNDVILSLFSQS